METFSFVTNDRRACSKLLESVGENLFLYHTFYFYLDSDNNFVHEQNNSVYGRFIEAKAFLNVLKQRYSTEFVKPP